MIRTRTLAPAATLFFSTLLAAPALAEVQIHDAIAVKAYEAAPTGAIYFVLRNQDGPDDILLSATSDLAERTEVHNVVMNADGTMGMQQQTEGVSLPAESEVFFAPGGYHVMLLGLTPGEAVTVTFAFAEAGEVTLTVPFGDRAAAEALAAMRDGGAMDHGTMDHGAMDHADTTETEGDVSN